MHRPLLIALVAFPAALSLVACEQVADHEEQAPPAFVGAESCAACHAEQFDAWAGSHHADAMQVANEDSVLGDVGVSSVYSKRDGEYRARIENENGELRDYAVKYTFGVSPLQQYLVEFPNGRLQVLPLAWDSRPSDDGGQRWFHVYGDEVIAPGDLLHWTGREQNWNYMCAECHSTGLKKGYSESADSFDTSWAEINVACEACHGRGSRHIADPRVGFEVDLNDSGDADWLMNPATGIAERSKAPPGRLAQPEACGRCHSRRGVITGNYEYGRALSDTHLPSLLEQQLYYADGQIQDEVYVYGSFLQSKMYAAGVSCSDCHDPHSAELKTSGPESAVCSTCHLPTKFDSPGHHHHPAGNVQCVDCHMPARKYMVVDPRRDHGFHVPRPELTIKTGSPNACNGCHDNRDASWAADAVAAWYGKSADGLPHFAEAIHAGRLGKAGANAALLNVIEDERNSAIVRATALTLLSAPFPDDAGEAIKRELSGADPLIRIGALRAMEGIAAEYRAQWAAPLLRDPIRAVRIEAVLALSPARDTLRQSDREGFKAAELEYIAAQKAIAERPEAHINLGNLYVESQDAAGAEASYRKALRMEPRAIAARANLADLFRQTGRDSEAEKLLRDGLAIDDESAALHHSLGLMLVRSDQSDSALNELARAAELDPGNARFVYVHAIALNSSGQTKQAISVLARARQTFPGNYDIAWALATMYRDLGRTAEARAATESLLNQFPDDRNGRLLLDSL